MYAMHAHAVHRVTVAVPATTSTTTRTTDGFAAAGRGFRRRQQAGERRRGHVARVAEGRRNERRVTDDEEEYAKFIEEARAWTMYDPDHSTSDELPPWEVLTRKTMEEGPWPCWDATKPESDFLDPPRFVSFTKPPAKFDPFEEKIKLYKEAKREEQRQAMAKTREEVAGQRFMSMADDIRLKSKIEDDESAWNHDKIMEMINFPEDMRRKMMSVSVEVYDPRFPYDFSGMGPPPLTTEEFLQSIGRMLGDDETDLERVAKIADRTGSTVPELVEEDPAAILQQRSTFELQNAMDIGDDEDISSSEITDLVDSDD